MMRRLQALGTLAILVAAFSHVGCRDSKMGLSRLGTKIGDREIKATVEGPGFISSTGDSAIVSFHGGKLTIERQRLLLDGKEIAKIPEKARTIAIEYSGGKLTARADDTSILAIDVQR